MDQGMNFATFPHRLAVADDGAKIAYYQAGSGSPVVLIQGTGLTGMAWSPQIPELAKSHQVTWIDNRGIGLSKPGATKRLSIDLMAKDVLAVLNAAEISSAHIVGHSLGGIIAQQVASDAPGRVQSLSLLCTLERGRDAVMPRADSFLTMMATLIGSSRSKRNAFAKLVSSDKYMAAHSLDSIAENLERVFGRSLHQLPSIVSRQMMAMWNHRVPADLSKIEAKRIIVVAAERDNIAPPKFSRDIAQRIGSAFVLIPDEGHAVPVQNPDVINQLLLEHFKRREAER